MINNANRFVCLSITLLFGNGKIKDSGAELRYLNDMLSAINIPKSTRKKIEIPLRSLLFSVRNLNERYLTLSLNRLKNDSIVYLEFSASQISLGRSLS